MCKILCSTGAILGKANDRNYRLLDSLANQLSCDGFEFMMYSSWYSEINALTDTLQKLQLPIPVMHCEKHIGEAISKGEENLKEAYRLFEINCNIANKIGAGKLVVHLWDGRTSDANFQNNLKAYSNLNETAKNYGIDLLIENVVCNREDPMKHWCELMAAYPDIHFVYDTKMAAFHEQLELLFQTEYEWLWKDKHICHYHVNDYGGGYKDWKNLRTLPIGKGHIDFTQFFNYIQKIGYHDTFTVEATALHSDGSIDTDMLNGQFAYIRNLFSNPVYYPGSSLNR